MKQLFVFIHNLILFTLSVLWYAIPPWRWLKAWRDVQADHLAEVRKAVWELKKQGRIYEDKNGGLWVKSPKE